MASLIARRAFTTTARRLASGEEALKTESKKNPEIMVRQIPTAIPARSAPLFPDRSPAPSNGTRQNTQQNTMVFSTRKGEADRELAR